MTWLVEPIAGPFPFAATDRHRLPATPKSSPIAVVVTLTMVGCEACERHPAQIRRPRNGARVCSPCFFKLFEGEIHETIVSNRLFERGDRVAIGASGGKGRFPASVWLWHWAFYVNPILCLAFVVKFDVFLTFIAAAEVTV